MDDIASKLTAFLEDEKNVEMLKGLAGGLQKQGGAQSFLPASLGALGKLAGEDDRTRLMRALKPFLSREKQQHIETLIRFLGLGELVTAYLAERR